MSLDVDSSKALLRPSELRALILAVRNAAGHEEHRWIEWKSTLDLQTAKGLSHIVKAVVGFANRQPEAAARHAEGYGYLLVGVEPGVLAGVQPVDPETLVGQVRAAVGDGVRWTPEYVRVDGTEVLVVVVDPPRPGDPIHCLRKQVERYQPGTIFVRHTGRTDQATPADLDMLQSRLLARSETLQLLIAADPATLEAIPDIGEAVTRWTTRRRSSLRAARHGGIAGVIPGSRGERTARAVSLSHLGLSGLGLRPDSRTEEQYFGQIDQYLTAAEPRQVNRAQWYFNRHEAAWLHVYVSNPTETGFKGVRLDIHIPGEVSAIPDALRRIVEGELPPLPAPPAPLGTPIDPADEFTRVLEQNRLIVPSFLSASSFDAGLGPAFTVADTGSVTIAFREFDLRPGEKRALPPVPLRVRDKPDTNLKATWQATGDNVRGRLNGEIELTTAASTFDLDVLSRADDPN